jgi:hypothetical protein
MLYAGSNLDKAREVFAEAINHRPRIRLTIRQRSQVLERVAGAKPDRPRVAMIVRRVHRHVDHVSCASMPDVVDE